ncbi:MAG: hypothetical protein ACYCZF_15470 [Anaerolineae bacterium]
MSQEAEVFENRKSQANQELKAEELTSLAIVYNEIRDQLVRQLEDVNTQSTKASVIAGFDGLILAGILGSLDKIGELSKTAYKVWQPWVIPTGIILTIGMVLISFIFSLIGYMSRKYQEILSPSGARELLLDKSEPESRLALLDQLVLGYDINEKSLKTKITLITLSLVFLILTIFIISTVIIMYLYTIILN